MHALDYERSLGGRDEVDQSHNLDVIAILGHTVRLEVEPVTVGVDVVAEHRYGHVADGLVLDDGDADVALLGVEGEHAEVVHIALDLEVRAAAGLQVFRQGGITALGRAGSAGAKHRHVIHVVAAREFRRVVRGVLHGEAVLVVRGRPVVGGRVMVVPRIGRLDRTHVLECDGGMHRIDGEWTVERRPRLVGLEAEIERVHRLHVIYALKVGKAHGDAVDGEGVGIGGRVAEGDLDILAGIFGEGHNELMVTVHVEEFLGSHLGIDIGHAPDLGPLSAVHTDFNREVADSGGISDPRHRIPIDIGGVEEEERMREELERQLLVLLDGQRGGDDTLILRDARLAETDGEGELAVGRSGENETVGDRCTPGGSRLKAFAAVGDARPTLGDVGAEARVAVFETFEERDALGGLGLTRSGAAYGADRLARRSGGRLAAVKLPHRADNRLIPGLVDGLHRLELVGGETDTVADCRCEHKGGRRHHTHRDK